MALSDEDIHKMAKARVEFKQHLGAYVVVNAFLTGLWFVTMPAEERGWATFWPVWPILGWSVGLAFHAFGVYGGGRGMVEREEERLRRRYG